MTFPTISAGTRANEAVGEYDDFVEYLNALAAGVDANAASLAGLGTAATKDTGTGAANVILGNDSRLTDTRTPTTHSHARSDITSLVVPPSVPVANWMHGGQYAGLSMAMTSTQGASRFGTFTNHYGAMTVSDIAIWVGSAAGAGALWRIGIWALAADGWGVGGLVADCGTIDPTTTGRKAVSGLSFVLPAGIGWVSLTLQGSGSGGGTAAAALPADGFSWNAHTNGGLNSIVYSAGTSGALPSTPPTTTIGYSYSPTIEFKRSA